MNSKEDVTFSSIGIVRKGNEKNCKHKFIIFTRFELITYRAVKKATVKTGGGLVQRHE